MLWKVVYNVRVACVVRGNSTNLVSGHLRHVHKEQQLCRMLTLYGKYLYSSYKYIAIQLYLYTTLLLQTKSYTCQRKHANNSSLRFPSNLVVVTSVEPQISMTGVLLFAPKSTYLKSDSSSPSSVRTLCLGSRKEHKRQSGSFRSDDLLLSASKHCLAAAAGTQAVKNHKLQTRSGTPLSSRKSSYSCPTLWLY